MLSLKKSTQYIILFLIFATAVTIGIVKSDLFNSLSPQDLSVDLSKVNKEFNSYHNMKKVKLLFHGSDPAQTIEQLKEIIGKHEIETVFSEGKFYADSQYFTDINEFYFSRFYEFKSEDFNKVMDDLRKIGYLKEEAVTTASPADFNIDIETRLKDQFFLKGQIEKKIAKSGGTDSMEKYQIQYEGMQAKIDSLNALSTTLKHNKEYNLLSLTVIKRVANKNRLVKNLKIFLGTTFAFLAIFIFIGLTLVLVMALGMKAMKSMGIRTAKGSSSSYNYYSRYKPYQRRVKKKYKEGSSKEDK
jgi:hypothetical protein